MTTKIITEQDLVAAAGYVRMSTDLQADSPERQKMQITEYATRNGYKIVRWYQDSAMSGMESLNRGDYQQLMKDATLGSFTAVLVAEMSRMSREDLFTVIPQWGAFQKAGITLVSCQRGVIDFSTMGGFITAVVDQFSAHNEIRTFATRSVTGKITKALQGQRLVGGLLGFDRNILDSSGNVLKRVPFQEMFRKAPDMRCELVPTTDANTIEAIRWAFAHVDKGGSMNSAALELNRRGIRSKYGGAFAVQSVTRMLTNPAYAGIARLGIACRGKYSRISDTHEPIQIEDAHPAIIDRDTFNRVAAMVQIKGCKRDKWRTYLLGSLCRCAHCGQTMYGSTNRITGGYYVCAARRRSEFGGSRIENTHCVCAPTLPAGPLERAVIRAWCDLFMTDRVSDSLKAKPAAQPPMIEQDQLKAVQEQIVRAEKNLALAEGVDDFRAVSGVLSDLRKRETTLRDAIGKANHKAVDLSPDLADKIARLKPYRLILDAWPKYGTPEQRELVLLELATLFKRTISCVQLRMDIDPKLSALYRRDFKRYGGVVLFNQDNANAAEVHLSHVDISSPSKVRYLRVVEFLKTAQKPQTITQIMQHFNSSAFTKVKRQAQRCEAEGLVRQTEAGWVACD